MEITPVDRTNSNVESIGPLRKIFLYIGLVYCSIIWGANFLVVKNAINTIDPIVLIAYRFTLAALFLGGSYYIFNCIREHKLVSIKSIFSGYKKGVFLGIVSCANLLALTYGLQTVPASSSAFIYGLSIAFVPFFSFILFRAKPSLKKIMSVILAIFGLWVLTGGMSNFGIGELLILISGAIGAFHVVIVEKFIKESQDMYIFIFQQLFTAGILALIIGLILRLDFTIHTSGDTLVLIYLILIPTFTAYVIQLVAGRFIKPFRITLILASEPIFATLFACGFGGESLTLPIIFGGTIIFIAILIASVGISSKLTNTTTKI